MSHFIKTKIQDGIAVIYLDRPEALNALNHAMVNALKKQLLGWQDDDTVRLVFIHGNGRAFCAGGDIRDFYKNSIHNIEPSLQFFRDEYSLNQLIHHYPKPYVAYLDGITMGGGVGVSLHGSHRIATPNLSFAMPETHIGFFPDIGARYHLTRLPHPVGLYLALSGNQIGAGQAMQLGIATHMTQADQADGIIQALAESDSIHKALEKSQIPSPKESALDPALLHCYEKNSLCEILSALKNMDNKLADELAEKSIFSLQTTFQSYQDAIGQPFDTVIQADLEIAKACLQHPDFYEGIRAMLIDKDKSPNWAKTVG